MLGIVVVAVVSVVFAAIAMFLMTSFIFAFLLLLPPLSYSSVSPCCDFHFKDSRIQKQFNISVAFAK